jgi:hypothetical protein
VGFCAQVPACTPKLDARLALGQLHGYNWLLTPQNEGFEVEPAYPGVTGSATFTAVLGGTPVETVTPGSEALRRRMLEKVLGDGSVRIARLMATDPESPEDIRTGPSPITGGQLSMLTDLDGSQTLSGTEIFGLDTKPESPVAQFLAAAKTEMKIGAANETATTGWLLPYIEQDNLFEPAFNYDFLSGLTAAFVEDPAAERIALLALRIGGKGSERGNERLEMAAAGFYLKRLSREVHSSLTRTNFLVLTAWLSSITELPAPPEPPSPTSSRLSGRR